MTRLARGRYSRRYTAVLSKGVYLACTYLGVYGPKCTKYTALISKGATKNATPFDIRAVYLAHFGP